MSKLPFFPLYVSDYNSATDWTTPEQDGVYFRALRVMWSTPGCSIPNDKKWIMRKLRLTDLQYEDVFLLISEEFLFVSKGRIFQKRLREEYKKAETKFKRLSEAGKKGGSSKPLKLNGTKSSDDSSMINHRASDDQASTSTSTSIKNKKENNKRKTSYQDDFIPSRINAINYWKVKSRSDLDYDDEVVKFKSYCKANGKQFVCWQSAWTTWFRNTVRYNPPTGNGSTTMERARILANE
jgi:uncharacterized protein YdaU (DUF1376 family)